MQLRETLSENSPPVLCRPKREQELHKKGQEAPQRAQKAVTPSAKAAEFTQSPQKAVFIPPSVTERKADDNDSYRLPKKPHRIIQTSHSESRTRNITTQKMVTAILRPETGRRERLEHCLTKYRTAVLIGNVYESYPSLAVSCDL